MARCKRVLLSIQSNLIPISLNWAGPLREAFVRAGVDCVFYPQGLHPSMEATLLDIVRPDVVLSMNEFRSDVLAQRPNIKHILWLQDDQVFGADYTRARPRHVSDIVYFMSNNLRGYYPHLQATLTDILMFAADGARAEQQYRPPVSDFSFIGYIPARANLTQNFDLGGGVVVKLIDLFPFVAEGTGRDLDRHPKAMGGFLKAFLKARKISAPVAPEKETFIRENVLRAFYRWTHAALAQRISTNLRLYGPQSWTTWPDLAPFYKGEVWSLDGSIEIFKSTKINLHNGASLFHPRVFECLGVGCFLMTNKVRGEPEDAMFGDGEHLVRYDRDSFFELAERYLRDEAARTKIAEKGLKFVLGAHTWDHRVTQILRQVDQL